MRNGAVLDGRYRIEQKLAAGGFGSIYRATDLIMGREVALKVLHRELANDTSVVERFRREASALARLRDPHTITMYDVGLSQDGTRYIVMELLRGESLDTLFRANGPLPWQRVVAIARGVCSSLREAHTFQIVHRDLKPANIHLERHSLQSDYVKVLDFGIAKLVDGSDLTQPSLTLSGQLVGTYDYMSPEQMIGGACTGRADIFALAVIIYEMIAGVRPYGADAKGPASMLMALLGTEPAPLSKHAAIPPTLDRVVMKALAQDPKDRLDVDELDDTLARILDAERQLALGTMDVPAAASSSSIDVAAPGVESRSSSDAGIDAHLTEDDEATWIDQMPPRNTPTTVSQVPPRNTPTTVSEVPPRNTPTAVPTLIGTLPALPTLIGTLPALRTPPRGVSIAGRPVTPAHGVPIDAAGRPDTPAHGVAIGGSAAQSFTPPAKVQRKTPLRGTPPPELQRKIASGPDPARRAATAKTELHEIQGDTQAREHDDGQARELDGVTSERDDKPRDDKVSRGHAPTEPPMRGTPPPSEPPMRGTPSPSTDKPPLRRTPMRGTPPPSAGKPPRGGMKTSASSEGFTRIETPRGLASGTARPPSKPIGSVRTPSGTVSPVGPTASIEQAIAEEIDQAVDAMVTPPLDSPKPEVSLPRPGSPAQAGIWPAPERVRPLTVRFAVGSGTELPPLESPARMSGAVAMPVAIPMAPVVAPPSVAEAEHARPRSALRYLVWAVALFGVGFAAAFALGAL